MLTSLATLLVGTTLFQRKARNGWLDELDGVRGEALVSPEDEIGSAMGPRNEVESTGDQPGTLPNHAWMQRVRTASAEAEAAGHADPVEDVAADLRARWEPVEGVTAEPTPTAAAPAPSAPLPLPPPPAVAVIDTVFETGPADPFFGEVAHAGAPVPAPAPHRDRPHEMWHQGTTVTTLNDEVTVEEERVSSESLGEGTRAVPGRSRFDRFRPVEDAHELNRGDDGPAPDRSAKTTESVNDFLAPPLVPFTPDPSSGGLLSGPVGRRRRDDARQPLPTPVATVEKSSPAPTAAVADSFVAPAPAKAAPTAPTAPSTVPVAVSASGEVEIDAPIVRLGQGTRAMVRSGADGLTVSVQAGSCWVSPLGLDDREVRVLVGGVDLVVGVGACALAVVESDGSIFLIAASGVVDATIADKRRSLEPGTMVLVPEGGDPQVDQARPEEIEGDPIVALNRHLDSTRNR